MNVHDAGSYEIHARGFIIFNAAWEGSSFSKLKSKSFLYTPTGSIYTSVAVSTLHQKYLSHL